LISADTSSDFALKRSFNTSIWLLKLKNSLIDGKN
jgi:hypothetical protein